MKFYIPDDIPLSYKYIVPNSNGAYFDLYDQYILTPNTNYHYYRFYNNLPIDCYTIHTRNITGTGYTTLNYCTIEPTHNYTDRQDYPQIVCTSAIIILGIVVLFNIITSLIKKGGLFSGLL